MGGLGAGLVGVATKLDQKGIRLYKDHSNYSEWEFLYEQPKQQAQAGQANQNAGQGGAQGGRNGAPGGANGAQGSQQGAFGAMPSGSAAPGQ